MKWNVLGFEETAFDMFDLLCLRYFVFTLFCVYVNLCVYVILCLRFFCVLYIEPAKKSGKSRPANQKRKKLECDESDFSDFEIPAAKKKTTTAAKKPKPAPKVINSDCVIGTCSKCL